MLRFKKAGSRSAVHAFALILLMMYSLTGFSQQQQVYGELSFSNSGKSEAQQDFLTGLLMLHSFQYEDARESFQKAQEIDPDFAMAYWGEAMSYNYPLWPNAPEVDRANEVLAKLGSTPQEQLSRAQTAREKAYISAVQTLFGKGDKTERDLAYLQAMKQLSAQYPDDLDAALFLALAYLGSSHGGRDVSIYMRAAAISEEVFAKNPKHPGAAHYLIHSYDDPVHAPLGLRAARVYADVAPSASHAQHMPSHIFYALGRWQEATASNINAYISDANRAAEKDQTLSTHGYHAIWWLMYSQLQEGLFQSARATLDLAASHHAENPSPLSQDILVFMSASYAVETGDWSYTLSKDDVEWEALDGRSEVARAYVTGVEALQDGDINRAGSMLMQLEKAEKESKDVGSQVMLLELQALIDLQGGETEAAMKALDQATALEESMPLYFGPPWPVKPSHELYGEVLLQLGLPLRAREQFSAGLSRLPARSRSLLGLARAIEAIEGRQVANEIYRELNTIWSNSDAENPVLDDVWALSRGAE